MAIEQFANSTFADATLVAGINASATSLGVSASANFPAVPQFRMQIDGEVMLVTGIGGGGTTFTVLRGQEGTSAASHSQGAVVEHVMTAQLMADMYANGVVYTGNGNVSWPSRSVKVLVLKQGTPAPCVVTVDPTAIVPFLTYTLKDGAYVAGANTITLTPASGLIDGGANFPITTNGDSVDFYSDGTNLWLK